MNNQRDYTDEYQRRSPRSNMVYPFGNIDITKLTTNDLTIALRNLYNSAFVKSQLIKELQARL